jgi:TRAP-type C4-dicarboxylate transport system permease small subunit
MRRLLGAQRAFLDGIARVEWMVIVVAMATMTVCIFAQVVSRYLFRQPLVWVEELSTYAFIWGTFIGASLGLKQARHIKIQSFVSRLPRAGRRAIVFVTHALIAGFASLLVVNGVRAMLLFEWSQTTIALPVELPRWLFYSTPLVLGGASMVLTALAELVTALVEPEREQRAEAPASAAAEELPL